MTSKTFNTIEENINFAMIDYIRFIVEERQDIINLYHFNRHLNYDDDAGEWLIYEILFRSDDYESELFYGFEIFCEENGYFCKDDFDILNEYARITTGEYSININNISKYGVKRRELYCVLGVCVNSYYYKKMGLNHEFIDIWNELNTVVRNKILK